MVVKPPRKGTRSCTECRRRKTRCQWIGSDNTCRACAARGSIGAQRCELQTRSQPQPNNKTAAIKQGRKTLRNKVQELERSVNVLLEERDSSSNKEDKRSNERGEAAAVTALLRDLRPELELDQSAIANQLGNAPVLTLFDNIVFCRDTGDGNRDYSGEHTTTTSSPQPNSASLHYQSYLVERDKRIFQRLRALAPSSNAIDAILQQSRLPLYLLRSNFPNFPGLNYRLLGDEQYETLRGHIITAFSSNNLSVLAKVMLILATCIQQLPPGFKLGPWMMPAPLEVLESCYLQSTEAFLASDNR